MIISEKQTYIDRFMKKIIKKDCWEWTACTTPQGYGQFVFNGKMQGAHRVSWQIHRGSIPYGMLVCHKCDNPRCVNPDHLFLGTHKDNSVDMSSKGRGLLKRGEKHPSAKLKEEDVKEIFNLSGQLSQREIAKKFNVSQGLIQIILKHQAWENITISLKSMSAGGLASNQKGSNSGRAKLSEKDVEIILKMRGLKTSVQVGNEFSVTSGNIRSIWARRSWSHLTANQQSEELKVVE